MSTKAAQDAAEGLAKIRTEYDTATILCGLAEALEADGRFFIRTTDLSLVTREETRRRFKAAAVEVRRVAGLVSDIMTAPEKG